MLLGQLHVRRTAAGGHERLPLMQLLDQLLRLMTGRLHRALRHLDHLEESQRLDSAIDLIDRSAELRQDRGSDDRHHRLALLQALQDIKHLRDLEDRAKRTSVNALATIDTFRLVDMLHTILIL